MRKVVLLVALAVVIYLAFRFLLPLVIPFVIAGIVSVWYYPFLRRVYKNSDVWESKNKKWVLVLSVILLYVVLFVLLGWICSYVMRQCQSMWLSFPFYQARIMGVVRECCGYVDAFLRVDRGESFAYIEDALATVEGIGLNNILPKVTSYSMQLAGKVFSVVFEVIVTVMATFFLIQDYERIRSGMLESEWGRMICRVIAKSKDTLKTYIKAQGLIMLLDGALCTLVFWLIGQPYFLVLGPLVGVLDALPVLGAGAFLIPYSVYLLITGGLGKAFAVVVAYLGCIVIRQLTEPKMLGNKIGMRPICTLASMYVGFQLFGVIGFLLGPVGVLIGQELYKCGCEKLV